MTTSESKVDMLAASGEAISTARDIETEMRAAQRALLMGDARRAHEHFDRGKRLSERLARELAGVGG